MRGLRLLLVGCLLAALAAPAGATSYRGAAALAGAAMPRAASVGGVCSKATAQQLTPDKVAGVLCGSFLGPGSDTMVLMTTNGTCMPFVTWDLYRLSGGSWQLVRLPGHGGFTGVPVSAVGSDLRETLPDPKPGQPVCLATATKSRVWHWDGSALVPGAWRYSGKRGGGTTTTPAREHVYTSPTGNIQCGITASGVYCQTFQPAQHADMRNGKLDICRGSACAGNPGENALYTKVQYGKSVTAGRFRCSSAFTGMTCVNTQTGKGFLIARAGIKRVG